MSRHLANNAAYRRGEKFWKRGMYRAALREYMAACVADPNDFHPLWAIGNCYTELRKPRKAENAFQEALGLCDTHDRLHLLFNLGNVLLDQERFAAAKRVYLEIPSSYMHYRKVKRNLAMVEERLNE